jgi:hypothetical protein
MKHESKTGTAQIIDLPQKPEPLPYKGDFQASASLGRCVAELSGLRSELVGVLRSGPKHSAFHGVVSGMAGLCGELRDYLLVMRRMEGV